METYSDDSCLKCAAHRLSAQVCINGIPSPALSNNTALQKCAFIKSLFSLFTVEKAAAFN